MFSFLLSYNDVNGEDHYIAIVQAESVDQALPKLRDLAVTYHLANNDAVEYPIREFIRRNEDDSAVQYQGCFPVVSVEDVPLDEVPQEWWGGYYVNQVPVHAA